MSSWFYMIFYFTAVTIIFMWEIFWTNYRMSCVYITSSRPEIWHERSFLFVIFTKNINLESTWRYLPSFNLAVIIPKKVKTYRLNDRYKLISWNLGFLGAEWLLPGLELAYTLSQHVRCLLLLALSPLPRCRVVGVGAACWSKGGVSALAGPSWTVYVTFSW